MDECSCCGKALTLEDRLYGMIMDTAKHLEETARVLRSEANRLFMEENDDVETQE